MKTYQDLQDARKSGREADVIAFIQAAIADHESSRIYQTAGKYALIGGVPGAAESVSEN